MICNKCSFFKSKGTNIGFCSKFTKLVNNVKNCEDYKECAKIIKIVIRNGKKEYIYG